MEKGGRIGRPFSMAHILGTWSIDHATGAMTVSVTFLGDAHCDAWPDYVVGETIDMTERSDKTCWIPNQAYLAVEMTYVGLNPPE